MWTYFIMTFLILIFPIWAHNMYPENPKFLYTVLIALTYNMLNSVYICQPMHCKMTKLYEKIKSTFCTLVWNFSFEQIISNTALCYVKTDIYTIPCLLMLLPLQRFWNLIGIPSDAVTWGQKISSWHLTKPMSPKPSLWVFAVMTVLPQDTDAWPHGSSLI